MPPTEIHDVTSASGPWRLRVEAAGSFLNSRNLTKAGDRFGDLEADGGEESDKK